MRKLYIAIVLGIVFLAAWLIDWNIRQGSAYLVEDQGSTIVSRDDDILELEIGYPGGKAPIEARAAPQKSDRRSGSSGSQSTETGEKSVARLHESEPEQGSGTAAHEPPETASWILYEVKKGDTLSEIAQKHLGTTRRVREIMELNDIQDAARIQVGMKLKIPRQ